MKVPFKKGTFAIVPNMDQLQKLRGAATVVYLGICYYADDEGQCFPSVTTLAEQTGYSVRRVQSAIATLEELGFITRTERQRRDGSSTSNLYQLNIVVDATVKDPASGDDQSITPAKEKGDRSDTPYNEPTSSNEPTLTKTREKPRRATYDAEDVRLTEHLLTQVTENFPFARDKATVRDYEEMNRLRRIDGRNSDTVEAIINWSQQDGFWKQNIRSVKKLRLQFTTLMVRAKSEIDQQQNHGALIL